MRLDRRFAHAYNGMLHACIHKTIVHACLLHRFMCIHTYACVLHRSPLNCVSNPHFNLPSAAFYLLQPMMRDDALRAPACAAGLARAVAARGSDVEIVKDPDVLREILAIAQNVLWDSATAPDFCSSGGLRVIAALLVDLAQTSDVEKGGATRSSSDPECRVMVFACAANALALCDTALSGHTHELRGWIDPLVRLLQRGRDHTEAEYLAASLANATRDPGLAHALRAVNGAEALERSRLVFFLRP